MLPPREACALQGFRVFRGSQFVVYFRSASAIWVSPTKVMEKVLAGNGDILSAAAGGKDCRRLVGSGATGMDNVMANYKTEVVPSMLDGRPADLPLVSAIIPAYNAEKFVNRAIESAIVQSHHLLEIIVVDDGSIDDTARAAARFPVTVIRQNNGGPASARNTGAKAARGEWLAFLDHDDTWHPEKTELQLKFVEPGIDAVFSEKVPGKPDVTFAEMFQRNYGGNPSSTIIRAETLRSLDYFDDALSLKGVDDYDLWLRFLIAGYKFATTPVLYNFTPAENHYGAHTGKMLSAVLACIDKAAHLGNVSPPIAEERKRLARLASIPELIQNRQLKEAREQIGILGFGRETASFMYAYLPAWVLNFARFARQL